jgi:hypothetical protein
VAHKRTRPKTEAVPERGLTGKQLAWIDAYIGEARFNGTKAARLAGYSGTDSVLAVTAAENLKKPKIVAELERRLKSRGLTADAILAEFSQIALGGPRDFIRIAGGAGTIDWAKLEESGRLSAIKKVQFDGIGNITGIEWYDKQEALDKLGKALGLWDRPLDADSVGNPLVEALRTIAGAGKKG